MWRRLYSSASGQLQTNIEPSYNHLIWPFHLPLGSWSDIWRNCRILWASLAMCYKVRFPARSGMRQVFILVDSCHATLLEDEKVLLRRGLWIIQTLLLALTMPLQAQTAEISFSNFQVPGADANLPTQYQADTFDRFPGTPVRSVLTLPTASAAGPSGNRNSEYSARAPVMNFDQAWARAICWPGLMDNNEPCPQHH